LELWALAFLTLMLALAVLNTVWAVIDNNLGLHSLGQELLIAAIAALIESASVAVVLVFIPTAVRALFIPATIVALLYKIAHYEDWSRYEVLILLIFQLTITGFILCLLTGHLGAAFVSLGVVIAVVGVIILIGKSL